LRPDRAMPQANDQHHGTYRCPVCGRRDIAVVELRSVRVQVVCSNCETPLYVSLRGLDSVRLSVQVAETHVGF
ncbi:MAG: hypothetical protein FWJ74_08000, partial [Gemmatimonadota bacterium]